MNLTLPEIQCNGTLEQPNKKSMTVLVLPEAHQRSNLLVLKQISSYSYSAILNILFKFYNLKIFYAKLLSFFSPYIE